ncbi:MAG: archease [Euryarchaeota archaeon]|nr:archease [Euryarchaeota archaeon]
MDFKYLDHPADLEIVVYGSTLEELFKNAARAMFNAISPEYEKRVEKCVLKRIIELKSDDVESLFYKWMSELVFVFDTEALLPKEIKVSIKRETSGIYRLYAELCGERFDLERHDYAISIKAMTYNMLEIKKTNGHYIAHFVMDV